MERKKKRLLLVVLGLLCFISLSLFLSELYTYRIAKNRASADTRNSLRSEVQGVCRRLGAYQLQIEKLVKALADDLTTGKLTEKDLPKRLKEEARRNPQIFQFGVAYAPGCGPVKGLYAPHYGVRFGKVRFFRLEEYTDYTARDWYRDALARGPHWCEPYYGIELKSPVTGFSAPFFGRGPAAKKSAIGAVRVTFSPENLEELIDSPEIRKGGFAFLASRKGTLITFPLTDLVEARKSLFDLTLDRTDADSLRVESLFRKALAGESGELVYYDSARQPYWLFAQPVPGSSWCLGATYLANQGQLSGKAFRQQKITITVKLLIFLVLVMALLIVARMPDRRGLWVLSWGTSLLCLAGTCFICYLTLSAPLSESYGESLMVDKAALGKFMDDQRSNARSLNRMRPVFIPTGLHIQALEFSGPNDLNISGYVWQKYSDQVPADISRGFVMPETKSVILSQSYRWKQEGQEVLGWTFEAKIREFFDYSKYPFDRQNIWVWLRHKDFDKNVMLVPDLDAYKLLAPYAYPGLQQGLVLPGYRIMGTFFNFHPTISSTNFGITNHARAELFPELYYNVIISRNFITPFISKIFPILIILSILFIVLLKFSGDEEQRKAYGLSGLGVLAIVIAFLLPVLLAQIELRRELNTERIVFIENFHLVTYLVLLLVAIAAYLFTGKREVRIVQYQDCLVAKLLYWPLITFLLLVLSYASFY